MSLIITKEFVNDCKRIGYLKYVALEAVDQLESKDKQIAELKAENERLVKCCKEYDSRQRIDERIKFNGAKQLRATKRALWLLRDELAHVTTLLWNVYCYQNNCLYFRDFMNEKCNPFRNLPKKTAMEWSDLWESIETKCRAKAEEYK